VILVARAFAKSSGSPLFARLPCLQVQQLIDHRAAAHSKMADDDTLNTTTTTGGGIIFDTYTDWWVFLTITVVCWSVVYGVVSKSMRDSAERERAA
jgi:hypothetical protein